MKSLMERFKEEVRCHNYCMKEAEKRVKKKDYIGAAVFLENVTRSLREMEELKKEMEDSKNGKVTITVTQLGFGNRYHD